MGESKMPARTPGPWSVGDTGRMVVREVPGMCDGGDYYSVAVTTAHSLLPESEALANAAFIVEACNQYDALKHRADLVEPLVEALQAIDAMNPHDHGLQGLWTAQKIVRAALQVHDDALLAAILRARQAAQSGQAQTEARG